MEKIYRFKDGHKYDGYECSVHWSGEKEVRIVLDVCNEKEEIDGKEMTVPKSDLIESEEEVGAYIADKETVAYRVAGGEMTFEPLVVVGKGDPYLEKFNIAFSPVAENYSPSCLIEQEKKKEGGTLEWIVGDMIYLEEDDIIKMIGESIKSGEMSKKCVSYLCEWCGKRIPKDLNKDTDTGNLDEDRVVYCSDECEASAKKENILVHYALRRFDENRAPQWSWTSVDAKDEITISFQKHTESIEIVITNGNRLILRAEAHSSNFDNEDKAKEREFYLDKEDDGVIKGKKLWRWLQTKHGEQKYYTMITEGDLSEENWAKVRGILSIVTDVVYEKQREIEMITGKNLQY